MVWKTERDAYLGTSPALVEVIEVSTFPELKIHSSASSFEVVYVPEKPQEPREEDRVRFSAEVEYFPIRNREDISTQERRTLWFRKSEMKKMRQREEACQLGEQDHCWMKDEPPKNDVLQEALHQLMAVETVLEEQKRQKMERIHDPELLARKYRAFVQRSRRSMFFANLARGEESKADKKTVGALQSITDDSS